MKKAFLNWSSGKDAALALYKIQNENKFEINKLVTTINTEVDRVSMHGIRRELLEQQAESLKISLKIISLDGNVSMSTYNEIMKKETNLLKSEGYNYSVFGDIFLEDLRAYRETQLKKEGITAVFPLWKQNSRKLMEEFLKSGFKAITVCVNSKELESSFCGRIIDKQFLKDLPKNVDPCGENGEFHTFVFDGPNFANPIPFEVGEKVQRSFEPKQDKKENCFSQKEETWDSSFWYCDLIPV